MAITMVWEEIGKLGLSNTLLEQLNGKMHGNDAKEG